MLKRRLIRSIICCFIFFQFISMAAVASEEKSEGELIAADEFLLELGMPQEEIEKLDDDMKQYIVESLKDSEKNGFVYVPVEEFTYFPEGDEILNHFLGLHLMAGDASDVMIPEIIINFNQESKTGIEDIKDKISCKIYRFTSEKYGEQICQTILDISSSEEIKVNEKDILYLDAKDFLWTDSPIEGELWTKNTAEEEWKAQKYISVQEGENHAIELSGSEWKTRDKYFRILLCLNSAIMPPESGETPLYIVNYKNTVSVFPVGRALAAGLTLVIIAAALSVGKQKLRKDGAI